MEDSVLPPTETANVWQLRIANLPHGMPLRFERHAASLVTSLGAHRPSCHSLANGGATKLARSALNPPSFILCLCLSLALPFAVWQRSLPPSISRPSSAHTHPSLSSPNGVRTAPCAGRPHAPAGFAQPMRSSKGTCCMYGCKSRRCSPADSRA